MFDDLGAESANDADSTERDDQIAHRRKHPGLRLAAMLHWLSTSLSSTT